MTRKEMMMIAETVRASEVTANLTDTQREDLALEFAAALKRTQGPSFSAGRFIQAATGTVSDYAAEKIAELNL